MAPFSPQASGTGACALPSRIDDAPPNTQSQITHDSSVIAPADQDYRRGKKAPDYRIGILDSDFLSMASVHGSKDALATPAGRRTLPACKSPPSSISPMLVCGGGARLTRGFGRAVAGHHGVAVCGRVISNCMATGSHQPGSMQVRQPMFDGRRICWHRFICP